MISGPIIAAREAASLVGRAVFVDARAGSEAAEQYSAAHVAGARRADLETDLSKPGSPEEGGRHPLPPLDDWLSRLGAWGVSPETAVIIYDDAGGGLAAARAWWMLDAIGHGPVAVVEGGWAALVAAGVETESGEPPATARGAYPRLIDRWPALDADFVERVRTDPSWRVIDARAPERYAGASEPLDPIAGHIPGAHNLYWKSQIDETGSFSPSDTLRRRYKDVLGDVPPERVVCYCGSGVTACHLLLAMRACGLRGARLYVGSWSEWCRQDRERAPS